MSVSPFPLWDRVRERGSRMKSLERVRWRCRRGLLELDIVLGRFVEGHYAQLDEPHRRAFEALLDMSDVLLWDMITGRGNVPQQDGQMDVLELLRAV